MAQPLAEAHFEFTSGIDAAASRLEQAFARLESAVAVASTDVHSLKVDHGKLNLLLQDADKEILRLREVTETVSKRLDKTISVLEAME